jgi:hypothetical protein
MPSTKHITPAQPGRAARRAKVKRVRLDAQAEVAGPARCPACDATLPAAVYASSLQVATLALRAFLEGREVTASQTAAALGVHQNWAGAMLRRAVEQGLLRRNKYHLPAGGYEWRYTPLPAVVAFLESDTLRKEARGRLVSRASA